MSRGQRDTLGSSVVRVVATALINVDFEQRQGPAHPAESQARGGNKRQDGRQRQGDKQREPSWDVVESRAYEEGYRGNEDEGEASTHEPTGGEDSVVQEVVSRSTEEKPLAHQLKSNLELELRWRNVSVLLTYLKLYLPIL